MRDPQASIHFDGKYIVRKLYANLPADHFLRTTEASQLSNSNKLIDFEFIDEFHLKSRRVEFVTHPTEWCDAQLLAAAQLTLELQRTAVSAGYELKDASAWNILFDGCKPIFCDLLSFVPLTERRWWAMGQFARHFVFPLLISRRRAVHGHKYFSAWRDGISSKAALKLLGRLIYFTRYAPLFLGSSVVDAVTEVQPPRNAKDSAESILAFRCGLQASLEWMIAGFTVPKFNRHSSSLWVDYESERFHYSYDAITKKKFQISEWLSDIKPNWVADFGCNAGEFTNIAANSGACVVALDSDHDSIQELYRRSSEHSRIFPVLVSLDDLSGGRGWASAEHPGLMERIHQKFDVVMMLALIHHLCVGSAIPLAEIAAFAAACSRKYLIIELIDSSDSQLESLCSQRKRAPAEFGIDLQRAAFTDAGFEVEAEINLLPTPRSLVLFRKK